MTALTYPDNARLEHTTKEAVASAILHQTYNALRGAGTVGRIIYREKPAKVLHTQFLLPRRRASSTATTYHEREDISSPAHISTLGMGFQIAARQDRTISVSITACIYVRILPSTADLVGRPVIFRLSKQARSVILRHRRVALSGAREANKELLEQEGLQSAAWLEIRNATIEAAEIRALEELGVAPTSLRELNTQESVVSILPERDEAPGGDDPTVSEGAAATATTGEDDVVADAGDASGAALENERAAGPREGTPIGDSDTLKVFEFIVRPGAKRAPPEVLTEREQIPQKWLRLSVDLGTLQIDLSSTVAAIDKVVADFNEEMRRQIEAELDKWEADPDPDTGGVLWGFPEGSGVRSRMITPGEVVAWDQTLATLRSGRKVARPTIEPVLEFENLEDPLHPDERTIRILLANESSLAEHDSAKAREQDASLYQAEVAVGLSSDLHRPITLERVAPSYRYNTYLQHDALGINCGVRRRRLTDANILETTALPVYFQPLIKQFEIDPAPEFARLSEKDGGLPILRSLLKAYDDWLKEVVESKPYARGLDAVRDAGDYQREKQQFETVDLRRWREERHAIERGVTILEQAFAARAAGKEPESPEAMPLTAWRFMNQSFDKFWSRKNNNVKQWRLFQLAFIVSQIPAIVSRLDHWKDNPVAFILPRRSNCARSRDGKTPARILRRHFTPRLIAPAIRISVSCLRAVQAGPYGVSP